MSRAFFFTFLVLGVLPGALSPPRVSPDYPWIFEVPTADTVAFLGKKVLPRTLSLYQQVWEEFLVEKVSRFIKR